jgi:hypothetical protein
MKWNDEVEIIVSHLDKVTAWLDSTLSNADRDKDWHTSRNSNRAKQFIELAQTEMYDMQYEEDPQGKRIWKKRINRD